MDHVKLSRAIEMAGIKLSKQIYKDVTIETEETGGDNRWVVRIDDGDEMFEIPEHFGSNSDAMRAGKKAVDEMQRARH